MMENIKQIIREEDGIRAEAASKIKAAVKRNENKNGIQNVKSILNKRIAARKTQDELKDISETDNKVNNAASTLQATMRGATQRKQDRAVTNMGNLTDLLNETAQYGNSQAVLKEYATKRQNIRNFGKLVSNKVKTINMVATKGDVIEGRAAEILQAITRRKAEKGLVNKKWKMQAMY
jgi:hypothetical protein